LPHYPGHVPYLTEAAKQGGVTDSYLVDQARSLRPLVAISSQVGQAYESQRNPLHRAVDLDVAHRQVQVLELALTAGRAILAQAKIDLAIATEGQTQEAVDPSPRTRRR
jgi:hypothetical protein